MHHRKGVKENGQHDYIAVGLPCLFLTSGMIDISTVRIASLFLGPTREPRIHRLRRRRFSEISGQCLRYPQHVLYDFQTELLLLLS
ncbi:hypothetical protein NPIL_68961 [Nephila pilipes]|uniref:Uncharacterized protein n=1 Tax=Nephila pilipes TaxID=299642 RepID=A0A8X6T4R1_NEPPI|nr:hypothetical protein NPIL_68961 [Nephila pilipes]